MAARFGRLKARSGAAVASVLLALSACGTADLQPVDLAASCPRPPASAPAVGPPDNLLDDFEDGDTRLARAGGRDGFWLSVDDGTNEIAGWENSSRCALAGDRAGHFYAAKLDEWGASLSGSLIFGAAGRAVPYDARLYGGISFWAAIGGGGSRTADVPLGFTTMDNAFNGGVCTTSCMDFYRATVTLASEWRRFDVRFADMHQQGWGIPPVPTMRTDQLVAFIMWPSGRQTPFDVWIDEIRLEP